MRPAESGDSWPWSEKPRQEALPVERLLTLLGRPFFPLHQTRNGDHAIFVAIHIQQADPLGIASDFTEGGGGPNRTDPRGQGQRSDRGLFATTI